MVVHKPPFVPPPKISSYPKTISRRMVYHPNKLMLIRPNYFEMNEQALETNKFMTITEQKEMIQAKALEEHSKLEQLLRKYEFDIIVYDNTLNKCPDAVFCNNWLSIHHPQETGDAISYGVLYPMAVPNRQQEVREDILMDIQKMYKDKFIFYDLREAYNWAFLESTGSIVFDRYHKTMYAGLSPRTYYWKLLEMKKQLNYNLVLFQTSFRQAPVYHTNVMLAMGKTWAVICKEIIVTESEQQKVIHALKKSGKEVIEIDEYQMSQYCGNILEIVNTHGIPYTIMSQKAYKAFTEEQRKKLGHIITTPLDTIEKYGGGGVRCCIAEV